MRGTYVVKLSIISMIQRFKGFLAVPDFGN